MESMKCLFFFLLTLTLSCCSASHTPANGQAPRISAVNSKELGRQIWANECAGSVQGLVSWNHGESFPSLGIGHFIWYPSGVQERFDESFPEFVAYARACNVKVPAFFNGYAPWPDKAAFEADRSGLANRMRNWLAAHVNLQTQFIIRRSHAALPAMAQASRTPQAVIARYKALADTTQGMYCLVDYVNFKGEGLKPEERYKGQGWGLLQVLEEMQGFPQGRAATAEFSRAAAAVMRRRVANSPSVRGEQRWLAGWLNRCASYK